MCAAIFYTDNVFLCRLFRRSRTQSLLFVVIQEKNYFQNFGSHQHAIKAQCPAIKKVILCFCRNGKGIFSPVCQFFPHFLLCAIKQDSPIFFCSDCIFPIAKFWCLVSIPESLRYKMQLWSYEIILQF